MNIVLSGIYYPVAILRYFEAAIKRNKDLNVFTVGPYTETWIPWNGGMTVNVPVEVTSPDLPLNPKQQEFNIKDIENKLPFEPDLWLQIDAGFSFKGKPSKGKNFVVGTDPHCVPGDTLVATEYGIMRIDDLCSTKPNNFLISSYDENVKAESCIFSGYKPTMQITLENGLSFECTDDHLIQLQDGNFKKAYDIILGDMVQSAIGTYKPINTGDDKDYSIGFVLGAFQGDGSFASSDIARFTISKVKKYDFGEAIKNHLLNGFSIDTVTEVDHSTCENAKILQVRRWGFHKFLKSMNLKSGHIPSFVLTGSERMIAGYVAGLLSADGCSPNGLMQITSKDKSLIKELQILLIYMGIDCRIRSTITNEGSYVPGKTYWNLFVNAGKATNHLIDLIGDIPGKWINPNSRRRESESHWYEVIKIEGKVKNNKDSRTKVPVYDIVNTTDSKFSANGIIVHNCLNYDYVRSISDKFFCMQTPYMKDTDIYLPYAYDPIWHGYDSSIDSKEYDLVFCGLQYKQRVEIFEYLKLRGYNIINTIGPAYNEAKLLYHKAPMSINWSSKLDLTARVFELLGMKRLAIVNRVPDLSKFFTDKKDLVVFETMVQVASKVIYYLENPDKAKEIAENGHETVKDHTWDNRIKSILEYV